MNGATDYVVYSHSDTLKKLKLNPVNSRKEKQHVLNAYNMPSTVLTEQMLKVEELLDGLKK